jgi:hypothetical protein
MTRLANLLSPSFLCTTLFYGPVLGLATAQLTKTTKGGSMSGDRIRESKNVQWSGEGIKLSLSLGLIELFPIYKGEHRLNPISLFGILFLFQN